MDINKDRLYTKYMRLTSRIQILVALDTVVHGTDVPDIYHSIQYGMPHYKSYNMLTQRFGQVG
jgi:superfamily II DNA or RNA helicase